jgi:hypothetical protein
MNCKQNLHLLLCRAHIQDEMRGPVYNELEFWVERMIQLCKSKVRDRTHDNPEKVMANFLIEGMAIEGLKCA